MKHERFSKMSNRRVIMKYSKSFSLSSGWPWHGSAVFSIPAVCIKRIETKYIKPGFEKHENRTGKLEHRLLHRVQINFNRSRYYMCKKFSINNIVSTPEVFMKFFSTIKQLLIMFKLCCERKKLMDPPYHLLERLENYGFVSVFSDSMHSFRYESTHVKLRQEANWKGFSPWVNKRQTPRLRYRKRECRKCIFGLKSGVFIRGGGTPL